MEETLKPYRHPNRSRLDEWYDQICQMRSLNWPYAKIVEWLLECHDFQVAEETVRRFCKRQGIIKGTNIAKSEIRVRTRVVSPKPKPRTEMRFDFDESKPIERWPEVDGGQP